MVIRPLAHPGRLSRFCQASPAGGVARAEPIHRWTISLWLDRRRQVMTGFDHDRRAELRERDRMAGLAAGPPEPPMLTTPRRAIWSAASMLAIVVVMFVVFYGINAQRTHQTAPASAAITTSGPDQTAGQR